MDIVQDRDSERSSPAVSLTRTRCVVVDLFVDNNFFFRKCSVLFSHHPWLILLVSPAGMAMMQTAQMASRLKAADPTIVPGPSSPLSKLLPMISMQESRISGAELPRAISVRLATVPFQTGTSIVSGMSSCKKRTKEPFKTATTKHRRHRFS